MRIAVTGATGYVGASLIAYLVQHFQRYEIIALVRETSNVRTLEKYSGIKIMKIDFFDPLFLDTALENLDVLVHTAALVSYFKSDYTNMVKANILLTRELVNASLRMNVKKFIHISSVAAIGINECFENGSDESISNEQSVFEKWQKKIGYMNTKYQAELEVIRATEENLDTVILNPGIIIGSYVDHVYGRGKIMMEKILSKKISIVPKGGAAFVGIEDVLCSIVKAITMGKKGRVRLLEVLDQAKNPMTVEEIFKEIRSNSLNLVTVYRSLNDFVNAKLVSCLDFHDGHKYEIRQMELQHHHYIVCRKCNQMFEVSDQCNLKEIEERIKEKTGFKHIEHHVAFYGVCNQCEN
ncbi:hypothetical protein CHS0354_000570 [Potamilus streckersoni]|uniref:NAD-dependent epimerase/dehydratase domain-containing protein n=1 Tax=Potamilus streckersoni TaxID=2493646 RepID=A0AAE0W923_9BIVA|nr:hypothetical protein CHS0354_000570 [Potamilus streckersoni]